VTKILGYLAVRDMLALSAVNHHLRKLANSEDLWRALCYRDFGTTHKDHTTKTFKLLYRTEYLKKKPRKTKKDNITAPQGEEKDTKGKKNEQVSKEVVEE